MDEVASAEQYFPADGDSLHIEHPLVQRSLKEHGSRKFRIKAAHVLYQGKPIGHAMLSWTSSDTTVATVDEKGWITLTGKVGETVISAAYEDADIHTAHYLVKVS